MDGLVKAAIIGGIGYAIWKSITPATSTPAAAAAAAPATAVTTYQSATQGVPIAHPIIVTPPTLSPTMQAGIDAYAKTYGLPTDAQLASRFGWQDFNDWFNSLSTEESTY